MERKEGVIDDLLAGTWVDPHTGKTHGIPIKDIAISPTLAGEEAHLVRALHGDKRITVVHDEFTRDALGAAARICPDKFVHIAAVGLQRLVDALSEGIAGELVVHHGDAFVAV
ncbi:MAG: hypothetical protein AAFW98_07500, partial [Pseudomonadota bacterium]